MNVGLEEDLQINLTVHLNLPQGKLCPFLGKKKINEQKKIISREVSPNIFSIYYCWTFALDLAVLSKYAKKKSPYFFLIKQNCVKSLEEKHPLGFVYLYLFHF